MKTLPILLIVAASSTAASQGAPTRGELLYTTHCVACHDRQVHWRDHRRATDWDALKVWVRRWEQELRLDWNEADVAEVARYLNDTIYKLPQTSERRSHQPGDTTWRTACASASPRKSRITSIESD